MSNTHEQAARILVEAGYAKEPTHDVDGIIDGYVRVRDSGYGLNEKIQYMSDTLEGRRQLDAIEDYLVNNYRSIWHKEVVNNPIETPRYRWRKDRIKWLLNQLTEREL